MKVPTRNTEPVSPGPVVTSLNDARLVYSEAQRRLKAAHDRQHDCRVRVTQTLRNWQIASMTMVTTEQLLRQHLASETQLRKDRAEGRAPPRVQPRRLGSAIDSFAFHTKNMGRSAGGGRAFARPSAQGVQGSFPPSMRGRTLAPKE